MASAKPKKSGASAKSKSAASGRKSASTPSKASKSLKPKGKPAKPAPRKAAPAPKKAAKPARPVAKKAVKAAPKPAAKKAKPAPSKKVARPAAKAKPAKAPAKKSAKPAPKPVAPKRAEKAAPKKSVVAKAATAIKHAAAVAVEKTPKPVKSALKTAAVAAAVAAPVAKQQAKSAAAAPPARPAAPAKAARRPRTRILSSDGGPLAAWIQTGGERPRPSSFIPAPPRAESPSQIAAPPASSDRLIRSEDLQNLALPAIRTFPIRVEIEQAVGRTHILVQPNSVTLRAGDGLEWDFRYLGGADTFIDEIIVDFGTDGLFNAKVLRSKNPGSARPHRQLSGRLAEKAPKGSIFYTIRCHAFGTEIAKTSAELIIT